MIQGTLFGQNNHAFFRGLGMNNVKGRINVKCCINVKGHIDRLIAVPDVPESLEVKIKKEVHFFQTSITGMNNVKCHINVKGQIDMFDFSLFKS